MVKPEPCESRRFDAIDHSFHKPFLFNPTTFAVESMISIEARGNDLVGSGVGQHVTRKLLHRKLVERHVSVVGLDDPFPPRPDCERIGLMSRLKLISSAGDAEDTVNKTIRQKNRMIRVTHSQSFNPAGSDQRATQAVC